MTDASVTPLVYITREQIKDCMSVYGNLETLESTLKENVDALKEWCKKQPHFVTKDLDDIILEKFYMKSCSSLEKTKQSLEKFCTTRGIMSEITLNRRVSEFDKFFDVVNYIPLPKLNPFDSTRVVVTQFTTSDLDNFNILTHFRYAFMLGDYRVMTDYAYCERYILDFSNTSMSLLGKLNPITLKKAEILSMEAYGTKIKGIHLINAPSFLDKIVFILKQGLKGKVASRIFIHDSYEDLQKHISKSILPNDYNGDEQSLSKLGALWRDEISTPEFKNILHMFDNLITDESLRQNGKVNEDLLGLQGSFRKLNFD